MVRDDLHLLVVEDDVDMRGLLEEILRPLGTVTSVPDVYQALNAVQHEPVDAIVLDLVFPGASGFDLMERLRTLELPTPVVVVTGLASDAALRRARALGAHAFVTKPFDVDLLVRAVADAAARNAITPSADADGEPSPTSDRRQRLPVFADRVREIPPAPMVPGRT